MFYQRLPKSSLSLPTARRALKGFIRDEPPRSADPLPVEALALLADHLIEQDTLESVFSATAMIVSYDLFLRPSEMLYLRGSDIKAPRVNKYQVAVLVAQLDPEARSREAPRPAKSGEFGDTIVAGLAALGLPFVPKALLALQLHEVRGAPLLDPLTLAQYENAFRKAARATGLSILRPTPHACRHGGASLAAFRGGLDAAGIQRRGRWVVAKSVRRYEKHGKLLRQIAKMDKTMVRRGAALLDGGSKSPLAMRLDRALLRHLRRRTGRPAK